MLIHTDKTELFISKANKIHKNRYDYSKVNYIITKYCYHKCIES